MKYLKYWWVLVLVIGFLLSRLFILKNPPCCYSDVTHDYERYANMWWYGLPPYFKQYYEYPPATIPLLVLPLFFDQIGIGKYYLNYRIGIFLIDTIVFIFILKALNKLKISKVSRSLSILFYLIAPVLAKDFFYEGIDLAFSGFLTIGIISVLLYSQKKILKRIAFWSFFWGSVAIKFMTAPLLVPFFYLKKLSLKKEIIAFILGFLLIWGGSLTVFRSSLSVSFVFHGKRPLKYAAFPYFLVDTINKFTKTETFISEPPDFPLVGPVSQKVTKVFSAIFPASILLVLLYSLFAILKNSPKDNLKRLLKRALFLEKIRLNHLDPFIFSLKISLIFIFTLFLTGKTFSQPFHIWYIPLLAVFPFKNIKKQLIFMTLAIWMILIDTNPITRRVVNENQIFIAPLTWKFVIYSLRFLPMFLSLFLSFTLPNSFAHYKQRE